MIHPLKVEQIISGGINCSENNVEWVKSTNC